MSEPICKASAASEVLTSSYPSIELTCTESTPLEEAPEPCSETCSYPEQKPNFQNQYSFKLFSPQCPLWNDGVLGMEEVSLEGIPQDQTAILAKFDLQDPSQSCMGEQLGVFLDSLNFDGVNRKIHGKDYGHKPVFDSDLKAEDIRRRFAAFPELNQDQQNALLFFTYGEALKSDELKTLFAGQSDLFETMKTQNLFVAETHGDETVYRLNGLSLTSQRLPNRQTIYLFNDLPARLNPNGIGEPTAQISETSYFLLNRLMDDYSAGVKRSGVMADFGAGTGLQALALLKMYPGITQAISLEIDEHSMNLNRLNAMMNGVSDRVQVLDNSRPENLSAALEGSELDFAVSNPPFNIVPKEYESSFTHFGYGGDHGIEITKIFLDQAMPLLKKGGDFVYYSYLAKDKKGDYFVTKYLQDHFNGLNLSYDNLEAAGYRYFKLPRYAEALAKFMVEHGLISKDAQELAQDIEKKLSERGVSTLDEKIGRIVKRGDTQPVRVLELKPLTLEPLKLSDLGGERFSRPGGVYERMETLGTVQGGERIERLGGVYLQRHQMHDFKKELETLLKDPEFRKKVCHSDQECEKLLSDPKLNKK